MSRAIDKYNTPGYAARLARLFVTPTIRARIPRILARAVYVSAFGPSAGELAAMSFAAAMLAVGMIETAWTVLSAFNALVLS